jgi:predicted amidohydrolase YtcJ
MNDRNSNPDLILRGGNVTTLDRANPLAAAVAISKGKFVAVGSDKDVMNQAGPDTQIIELKGRRVLPGLVDNHMHIIRGGLNFNMELRWDGVRSLADAMAMLKRQVAATPPPQWVRVVGGFSETQFVEKRLPTIDEVNAVAPDTPVFLLHLYDRAILNAAALRVVGYTKETPDPPGSEMSEMRGATRQACYWLHPMPQFFTLRWRRDRSCLSTTNSIQLGTSCAS